MRSICSIEGCSNPVVGRGWCRKHYTRWQRWGDPEFTHFVRTSGTPEERWHAMVEKSAGCWLWIGPKDRHGYGQFDVYQGDSHKNYRAHRFGYQMLVRPLAEDETLDHLCRVHACVNPDHLDPVSHAVNVGRGRSGEHNRLKTHCAQGHSFSDENTLIDTRGFRQCRTCRVEWNRKAQAKYRQKLKAKKT